VLLFATPSAAQTINLITGTDKERTLSVIAAPTEARDGVSILAFDPMATKVVMRGDGAALITCDTTGEQKSCRYVWTKAAMTQRRCVSCELIVTATDAAGKTIRAKSEVIRP
jgi:hypothetical protein